MQFNVSVGTVHTIIHEELKMQKICTKFVPRVLREDQKERRCYDIREMVELINSDPAVLDALVTCNVSWIYCYDPETKRQSSQWKHTGSPDPRIQSFPSRRLVASPSLKNSVCPTIYHSWRENNINQLYINLWIKLFVAHSTKQASTAQGLFKLGPRALGNVEYSFIIIIPKW